MTAENCSVIHVFIHYRLQLLILICFAENIGIFLTGFQDEPEKPIQNSISHRHVQDVGHGHGHSHDGSHGQDRDIAYAQSHGHSHGRERENPQKASQNQIMHGKVSA